MIILLGVLIGFLISILILLIELWNFRKRTGIIDKIEGKFNENHKPQGFIFEPLNDKKEAINQIIKENDELGLETPYDDISN